MESSLEALLRRRLDALDETVSLRLPDDAEYCAARSESPPEGLLDLTSNDYLGLGRTAVSRETLDTCLHVPPGGRASRLIFGTHPAHTALERELAAWVGLPSALLFSAGYAANVGTLAALAGPGDTIFSDALNHASIIDGCRLSRAHVQIYHHCDLDDLDAQLRTASEQGHRWVVTETYFSMDADTPDLERISAICRVHRASLIVDEAHALGVFGPYGSGLCQDSGVRPDALIGTLGKAVGAQGAFVAGSAALRTYLWNRARSFVFSTAPSPFLATLTAAQVRRARAADAQRARLHAACHRVRGALDRAGAQLTPNSHGPILPLILGTNAAALDAARTLSRVGIRARAIRPPTVPPGTARLRVTLDATLADPELDRLVQALLQATPCPGS